MKMRILLLLATGAFLWTASTGERVASRISPPASRVEQSLPSYDGLALAESSRGSQVPVLAASAPQASPADDSGSNRRRKHRHRWIRVLLIVLLVLVCVLTLALVSKAITLCLMERMIRDHEREHGCKIRQQSCKSGPDSKPADPGQPPPPDN